MIKNSCKHVDYICVSCSFISVRKARCPRGRNGALTGQVKLRGRRSRASGWMLKESVPKTGVATLPNIQSPGDTTVWKFFKQTLK